MEFIVVGITRDISGYPEDKEDTEMYPHLVQHVRNADSTQFVIDMDTGDFWPAEEFFAMNSVRRFSVLEGHVE